MKLCEKAVFVEEGFPYGACRRMCFHPGPCMLLTKNNPTPPIFDQIVLMVERIEPANIHTRMNVPNWAELAHDIFRGRVAWLTDQAIYEEWLTDPTKLHDLAVLQHATQLIFRNSHGLNNDLDITATPGVPEPPKLVTPDEPWMAIAVDALYNKRYRALWDTLAAHTPEVSLPGTVERTFNRQTVGQGQSIAQQSQFTMKSHDDPTLISIFQSSDVDSMNTLVVVQPITIQEPKS